MTLLSTVLSDDAHKHPLLILQSSLAQSALPIIHYILDKDVSKAKPRKVVLFSLLYSPTTLWNGSTNPIIQLYDWTDRVPGYSETSIQTDILKIMAEHFESTNEPTTVIIDSADALLSDIGSVSKTYKFLSQLYDLIKPISTRSRLIVHTQSPSSLVPLLSHTSFSAALVHVIAHPPVLVSHIARELFVPPPPLSPDAKFWNVFIPISERVHDTEQLVFGSSGQGSGHPTDIVVEVIVRDSSGRKRGVDRVLEGWSSQGPVDLLQLDSLAHIGKKEKEAVVPAPDPTKDLSFNLNLTASQQQSRAQVPLPYAHEGQPLSQPDTGGAIFYDPDSADDIDDDDPDEDLDI